MIFILAIVSTMWGYSLMMAIMIVVVVLYACMAYKVKRGDSMSE